MVASLALMLLMFARVSRAAPPPPPTAWVTDGAGVLSPALRAELDFRLARYHQLSGHQVVVWIGSTTGDVPIETFTVEAFERWKVGGAGRDDGLVLFLFRDDRKARIEVGYGLEERVPDLVASRIIREQLAPRLAAGDWDGGVLLATESLVDAIEGRPHALPEARGPPVPGRTRPLSWVELVIGAVLLIGFLVLLVTNPWAALFLIRALMSGHGHGGFGGGGGGFRGGGGRSGGGGATGSW